MSPALNAKPEPCTLVALRTKTPPSTLALAEPAIVWPALNRVGLSPAEREARMSGIGGSDANIILSGDDARVLQLWREKRGEAGPEDLSGALPVMLGCWTEAFNRQWYERQTGLAVSEVGSTWDSLTHPWRLATLDGLVESRKAVWEAKHVNAFSTGDEVLARYMPQLQHNMAVANVDLAILSVLHGNHKWETYEVARDWLYQDELLEAEQAFWNAVRSGTPPVVVAAPMPPKPVAYREMCFDGNNRWAASAADWVETVDPARRHAASIKALKALIPDDVCRAWGHGLEARRSKTGALSFREAR
jgi:hypothetical protein